MGFGRHESSERNTSTTVSKFSGSNSCLHGLGSEKRTTRATAVPTGAGWVLPDHGLMVSSAGTGTGGTCWCQLSPSTFRQNRGRYPNPSSIAPGNRQSSSWQIAVLGLFGWRHIGVPATPRLSATVKGIGALIDWP